MNDSSAQPCGCDKGANYVCELHRTNVDPAGLWTVRQRVGQSGVAEGPTVITIGIGGAPTRATTLPTDAEGRKTFPIATGCVDYFPDALAAVAHLSWKGNEQHNPGQPLHWNRGKSADEADTMMRHFVQRGTLDTDGVRHSVKVAWRALAMLQKELESEAATRPRSV